MKNFSLYSIDLKKVFLNNWNLSIVFFVFLSVSGLVAQAAKQPAAPAKDSKSSTAPAKKEAEDKPMKMESGTVVLDPHSVSTNIKMTNLKHLKKLKSSFYNLGDEQKFNELMKGYVEATITLGEKNYLEARRKFEQNQSDMNESAKGLLDKYKEVYSKLYADYSFQVVDMKINGSDADLSNSSYEKMLATGNEFRRNAEDQITRNNFIEALYAYKQAINQLIRIPYFINKNKNKNLKINERLAKDLIVDEDYIPKEVRKDYDDSLYLIHAEREKEREKERETVKKGIQSKLGSSEASPENKDADPAKPSSETSKKEAPSKK